MGKQLHPSALLSKKSGFSNQQPQPKQITPLLKLLLLLLLDKKSSKVMDMIFYWMKERVK